MKKTILLMLTIALLLSAVVPLAHGRVSLAFVAVNDTIPLTLTANEQPYYVNSTLYVPHSAFTASGLECYLSYGGGTTLALYNRNKRLDFNLSNNTATDENGNVTAVNLSTKNGYVYLPAKFCANHFGMSVSYLVSDGGYSVVRFTNGNQIYDNSLFIQRAENFITYKVDEASSSSSSATTSTTANPSEDETPEKTEPEAVPATIYLGILGGENLSQNLITLGQNSQIATFFLTEKEILENGATLRQLSASGHHLGIYANSLTEIQAANQAFQSISLPKTLLVATDFNTDTADFDPYYAVFSLPEEVVPAHTVVTQYDSDNLFLTQSDQLAVTLLTFTTAEALVRPIRETDSFPTLAEDVL